MSLQAIPNQPIGFVPSRLQGALCGADPTEVLPISDGDNIGFQFRFSPCEGTERIGDPTFTDESQWRNQGGWAFAGATVCKVSGAASLALEYDDWSPTVGTLYQVDLIVDNFNPLASPGTVSADFIEWSLGGVSGRLYANGTYSFTVVALTTQRLTFTARTGSRPLCISRAQVTEIAADNEVRIVDLDGFTIEAFGYDTTPEVFDYSNGYMTLNIPADADWGNCFRIEVDDPCNAVVYTSQIVNFTDPAKTIKIRACNVSDGMGFGSGFAPEARYISKLVRSTFDYNEGTERGTNGFINNYFAERLRSMEFRVDDAGEIAHDFLSTLPLWDHVYFGQAEYHVKPEGFEPDWGDIYEAHGSIIMPVEPKQEAMRKVRTMPDILGGCVPPPNFLVQGTGPNNDYITLNTGGRIALHE